MHLETFIHAPIDRCFDLMRDVDAHTRSTSKTRERAVAGTTKGLLGAGPDRAPAREAARLWREREQVLSDKENGLRHPN